MRRWLLPLLSTLLLAGCDGEALVNWLAPADDGLVESDWSLAALYDGAAVARAGGEPPGLGFSWQADAIVEEACGRPKGPIGLGGAMDAEIMGRAAEPYLVALLAGPADQRITVHDLMIFAGDTSRPQWLAPAVVPRVLSLDARISPEVMGADATKMLQQLQSQLTVQLCLEHQVGRAWQGLGAVDGMTDQVMQNTFMLDRVDHEDRRLFVGQGIAVYPLLGPPLWAPAWHAPLREPLEAAGAQLSAADLFAFRTPMRMPLKSDGSWSDRWMRLEVGGAQCPGCQWEPAPTWGLTRLQLTVRKKDDGLGLSASYELGEGATWAWNNGEVVAIPRVEEVDGELVESLYDVLSAVPYEFPRVVARPVDERGRPAGEPQLGLALLMIPNWQLANARADLAGDYRPLDGLDPEPVDAVGWFLEHPRELHIIDKATGVDLLAPVQGSQWTRWGSTPGFRASASPIGLAGVEEITSSQQSAAVRAGAGHLVLVAVLLLLIFLVPGLLRVPDLWAPTPRERAWGWPEEKDKSVAELAQAANSGEIMKEVQP